MPDAQNSNNVPHMETYKFSYKGKVYRVFKPPGSENWMIRRNYRGKEYAKRLSPFRDTAIKNAKIWLESLLNEQWEKLDTMRLRSQSPTIGEIIRIYEAIHESLEIDLRTVRDNIASLRLTVATALEITRTQVDEQRISVLTGELVANHQINAIKAGLKPVTISARLIKARSIFSRRALPFYATLKLPDLDGFMTQSKLRRRISEQTWQPFSEHTITEMESAAIKLKDTNTAMYRCYLLAARLGMRNGEILASRRDWIGRRNGELVIAIIDQPEQGFKTKTGVHRWLPLSDELAEEFTTIDDNFTSYLIAPELSDNQRRELIYRRMNEWIRKFIPDREKGLYELRKWAGSRVATETGNIYKAKEFLGHTTVLTTEQYYAKLLDSQHKLGRPNVAPISC